MLQRGELKVLFVSPGKAAYGSAQSMLGLLEHRRFVAEVVCPPGGPLESELRAKGIVMYPLEFGKYAFNRRPYWHALFYYRFSRILAQSRPDVMVINLDGNTPLVTVAAVRARIPIIRYSRFEFAAPERWLDNYCWQKAAAVICPSETVRQQVLAWAPPTFQNRVYCWYDPHAERPVSAAELRGKREELGLGAAKVIIYVGRLHEQKRIETAILALAEIRKSFFGARLLIVGGHDGSEASKAYEKSLKELVGRLGLEEAVLFLGYQPRAQVPVLIAASDVSVLPSETESFGMVLTEAWSVRVPTVASDVAGCREITRASGGGLLVPVGDHLGLARNVAELWGDPDLMSRCGVAGEKWVAANCDSRLYAERFVTLVEELASAAHEPANLRNDSGATVMGGEDKARSSGAAEPTRALTGTGEVSQRRGGPSVAIATFYHESHPGAVLQAYALSKALRTLGCRASMIAYTRPVREGHASSLKQQVLRIVTRSARREAAYVEFRSRFLSETPEKYADYQGISSCPPEADAYVCGSDQIWNPELLAGGKFDPAYFLRFGSPGVPRFSYAASFGGYQPNAAQCDQLRDYLRDFARVSVREPSGQKVLHRILGREVSVVLDPTLLPDKYDELFDPAKEDHGNVLLYALQRSPEVELVARTVAARLGRGLWSCGGPVLPWKTVGKRREEQGPFTWLERIRGAAALVTNSYHGMIFGLLLRKRVIVVPLTGGEASRNERIFHLSSSLGISHSVLVRDMQRLPTGEINWDAFDSKLREERERSLAYLRSALAQIP